MASPYWLRPSFIVGYMTGTVDELAYPLLLAEHGVPPWLLTDRLRPQRDVLASRRRAAGQEQPGGGRPSATPAQLPVHLVADEHHADWAGQKGYVATTVGGGCILGVALDVRRR